MAIPQYMIPSLCTAGGVILGSLLTAWATRRNNVYLHKLAEKSKDKDRELAERQRALNEESKEKDRELAERQRKLDLYKVLYPEKVKIVVELIRLASDLTEAVALCHLRQQSHGDDSGEYKQAENTNKRRVHSLKQSFSFPRHAILQSGYSVSLHFRPV